MHKYKAKASCSEDDLESDTLFFTISYQLQNFHFIFIFIFIVAIKFI